MSSCASLSRVDIAASIGSQVFDGIANLFHEQFDHLVEVLGPDLVSQFVHA